MKIDKNEIIKHLKLKPHPLEGGFYRRIYTSDAEYIDAGTRRKRASSIYYMLTTDKPIAIYTKTNQRSCTAIIWAHR